MVKAYTVHWTPQAKRDLIPVFNYIARVESLERANYVIDKLIDAGDSVAVFPFKHPKEQRVIKTG